MPLVSQEKLCVEEAAGSKLSFDLCMERAAGESVRIHVVNSLCTHYFPTDIEQNNECRQFCWSRTNDAASCVLEATTWISTEREAAAAHRHDLISVGFLLLTASVVISGLLFQRVRSAVLQVTALTWRLVARSIYAVSGAKVRRAAERWSSYRHEDNQQVESKQDATPTAEDQMIAATEKLFTTTPDVWSLVR